MKVLGIDSSSLVASVAVVSDHVLTAGFTVNYKKTHSQTLLPMLEQMMNVLGMDLGEVDAIAAAAGPGSFTGLRIGAATAKGLGLALGKPLAEVPTLEALACNLWGSADLVCPIMDARRNQVYTGAYRVSGRKDVGVDRNFSAGMDRRTPVGTDRNASAGIDRKLSEQTAGFCVPEIIMNQCAMDILELIEKLNELGQPVTFLGDGVPVYEKQIGEYMEVPFSFAPAQNNCQRAASVAALGLEYVKQGKTVTAAEFNVNYLRKSQAEREREEQMKAAATDEQNGGTMTE